MDAAESRAAARAAVRNTSPPAPAAPARAAPAPGTFVECRFTYDVPGEAQLVRWERGRVTRVSATSAEFCVEFEGEVWREAVCVKDGDKLWRLAEPPGNVAGTGAGAPATATGGSDDGGAASGNRPCAELQTGPCTIFDS